jgi:O-antigen/teichoic acid export membrane protein
MKQTENRITVVVGLSVILCIITGLISLLVTYFAFFGADWTGAGISLIAAALAFGLLSNALLRD